MITFIFILNFSSKSDLSLKFIHGGLDYIEKLVQAVRVRFQSRLTDGPLHHLEILQSFAHHPSPLYPPSEAPLDGLDCLTRSVLANQQGRFPLVKSPRANPMVGGWHDNNVDWHWQIVATHNGIMEQGRGGNTGDRVWERLCQSKERGRKWNEFVSLCVSYSAAPCHCPLLTICWLRG